MTEPLAKLAAALVAFQAEMPTVAKTKTARVPMKDGGAYSYQYADLADVAAAAVPLLVKHGLSFTARPRGTEHGYELAGVLLHESGEYIEGALPIFGSSAQQIGSSLTYARRYLLGCLTGVVTDVDDDGAAPPARRTVAEMTPRTRGHLLSLFAQKGVPENAQLLGVNKITGGQYGSLSELSEDDAQLVIRELRQRPDAPAKLADEPSGDDAPSTGSVGEDSEDGSSAGEGPGGETAPLETEPTPGEGEAGDMPPSSASPGRATRAQERMLMGELKRLGIDSKDRDERLYICGTVLGRALGSFMELSRGDASRLIDTLASMKDRAALDARLDEIEGQS